jgi:small-conductance mechanosensitive channel
MNYEWFFAERYALFGRHLSVAGITAFSAALVAGFILSTILQSARMRKLLSRLHLDKHFIDFITSVASLGVLVTSLVLGLDLAGLPINWHAPLPAVGLSISGLIRLVLLMVAAFWVSSLVKRFLFNRFLSRSGMDRALQYAVAQVSGYVALAVGVFVVLQNAGIDLSALAVFAGAVGVGLGMGLQNIASNFISGLVILGERPIKIGDRVEVGETAGTVHDIRTRSTTVITNDNIAVIVPNSHFIEETVINWSHHDPKVRFRVPIGVAYGSDVEKVRRLLLEVAQEHPQALREPPPSVFFESFGDSALNFQLVVWSSEMSWRPSRFRSDLNFAIERKLREAGIEIPFPQRDVHVRTLPAARAEATPAAEDPRA